MRFRNAAGALSRNGVCLLRRAVTVDAHDLLRLAARGCADGEPVFNGTDGRPNDERRRQWPLPADDQVLVRLLDALRAAGMLTGRTVGPAVVLHSDAGCLAQRTHTDYDADDVSRCTPKPLGVLLALQPATRLLLPAHGDVVLGTGDIFVFEGDVPHAGAAYDQANTRVHVYLDVPGVERPPNTTYY